MRLVFETKQLKHADDVRDYILNRFGVDSSVVVMPSNTVIVTQEDLDKNQVTELVRWMSEEMDGVLLEPKDVLGEEVNKEKKEKKFGIL